MCQCKKKNTKFLRLNIRFNWWEDVNFSRRVNLLVRRQEQGYYEERSIS